MLEHHAHLKTRVARTIRANFEDKTIGVNSWGMNFGAAVVEVALPSLSEMSREIDYFTEVDNWLGRAGDESRRKVIAALKCDFGTLGGPQVGPPQHWERDRWFLPVARRRSEHLRALAEDGGRSCEFFFHIDANAGDELSIWATGYALQSPFEPWQSHLRHAVERLYEPKNEAATQTLCDLFTRAEAAYYNRVPNLTDRTFCLEPLCHTDHSGCDSPGPPIYLDPLAKAGRAAYAADLAALFPLGEALRGQVGAPQKLENLAACLRNALADAQRGPT